MVKTGIVGIGNMGSAHAAGIYKGRAGSLELVSVADTDPARLKWAHENLPGVKTYSDYRQMFTDEDLDAVIIATPHPLHPVIACEAFARGLNVLTEKPAGIDAGTVRKMNEAARESGKVFAIMFNQRTNPLFIELRKRFKRGDLGELIRFTWIINNWYCTQSYYDSGTWRATWSGEGGGVLMNQCPHNLDIWQWITGMPKRIFARCGGGRVPEHRGRG